MQNYFTMDVPECILQVKKEKTNKQKYDSNINDGKVSVFFLQ